MMDIEKLIERLKAKDFERDYDCTPFECGVFGLLDDAATALSTLQAENSRLRAELEYEREHANAYHEECGQWEAENEKLRETVDKYATAARAIALHLKPFCDESLPYDEMIADAARKASDELEQVKRERDAARSDIETALAYGMKDCELCKNSQCYVRGGTKPCLPKWRGQKKD